MRLPGTTSLKMESIDMRYSHRSLSVFERIGGLFVPGTFVIAYVCDCGIKLWPCSRGCPFGNHGTDFSLVSMERSQEHFQECVRNSILISGSSLFIFLHNSSFKIATNIEKRQKAVKLASCAVLRLLPTRRLF